MTKTEKVPILGIFSPMINLMFRVGLKKIRVGRPTGTTHTFHLSLITLGFASSLDSGWSQQMVRSDLGPNCLTP